MITDLNYNTNLIMVIQSYLINIKALYPSLPLMLQTGVYDEATRNAVLVFQNIKGLPQTGFVDVPTLNKLVRENHEFWRKTQMPDRIPVGNSDFADVKISDQKDIVYTIKIMLNGFWRKYINYTQLEVTNLYDKETEETVRLFQQRSMLPDTGIVDMDTWNTLVKIYDNCRFFREMT